MFLKSSSQKLLYKSFSFIMCAVRKATSLFVQCGIKRDVCAAAAAGRDTLSSPRSQGIYNLLPG